MFYINEINPNLCVIFRFSCSGQHKPGYWTTAAGATTSAGTAVAAAAARAAATVSSTQSTSAGR